MLATLKRILGKLTRRGTGAPAPCSPTAPDLLKVREQGARHRQALELAHSAHLAFDEAAGKMGRTTAAPDGIRQIACASGCSHCCSLYVSATPTELLLIEAFINGLDDPTASAIRRRIRHANRRVSGKSMKQRSDSRSPCPLLSDNRTCSVYAARPTSCRAYISFDRSACARDERSPALGLLVPRSQSLSKLCSDVFMQLSKFEDEQGFVSGSYELVQGLNILIASPSAIKDVCDGKNPLAIARTR